MSTSPERDFNPLKISNSSDETVPPFGALSLGGVSRTGGHVLSAKPDGSDTDGLAVNSSNPLPAGEEGWGRPTQNGFTFWVLYSGTVEVGDDVGPVEGSFAFSTDGSGYQVLKINAGRSIAKCVATGGSIPFSVFEVKTRIMCPCSGGVQAWKLDDEYARDEELTSIEPDPLWNGVVWGADAASPRGEFVLCILKDGAWSAIGCGHTSFFVELPVGLPDIPGLATEVDVLYLQPPQCGGTWNNGEPTITVNIKGPYKDGETALAVWDGHCGFDAIPISVCVGTGLELDDDGCVKLDDAVIAQINSNTSRIAELERTQELQDELLEDLVECCEDMRHCCKLSLECCVDQWEAIDYINDNCCTGGGVPGADGCNAECIFEWDGATWTKIVDCFGQDADCDCDAPDDDENPGEFVGDFFFSVCSESLDEGDCCPGETFNNDLTVNGGSDGCVAFTGTISKLAACWYGPVDIVCRTGPVGMEICGPVATNLTLCCTAEGFRLYWSCGATTSSALADTEQCSPLRLTFTIPSGDCNCADDVSIVITE